MTSIQQQFEEFNKNYKYKSVIISGKAWQYYDIGKSKKILLLFPNVLVSPESWFPYIDLFKKNYRIIIPRYPPYAIMNEYVENLHTLLQTLHISSYTIIANSFGGMIAQLLVRTYPREVEKILLLATIPPNKMYGLLGNLLRIFGLCLPPFGKRMIVYTGSLLCLNNNEGNFGFWNRFLKKHIWSIDIQQYWVSLGKSIINYCFSYQFQPNDLKIWNRKLVLVETNDDVVFFGFARKSLRDTYPQAKVYSLKNAGHLLEMNRIQELSSIFSDFLR